MSRLFTNGLRATAYMSLHHKLIERFDIADVNKKLLIRINVQFINSILETVLTVLFNRTYSNTNFTNVLVLLIVVFDSYIRLIDKKKSIPGLSLISSLSINHVDIYRVTWQPKNSLIAT